MLQEQDSKSSQNQQRNQTRLANLSPSKETVKENVPALEPDAVRPGRIILNRVKAIMIHIPWYTFEPSVRLARDSGVSSATISRLLRGQKYPSLRVATAVTAALSMRLGRQIPLNEVFSSDGGFPTPSTCELCKGTCVTCTPEFAYDSRDRLKQKYRDMLPGEWCLYPQSPTALPTIQSSTNLLP